MKTKHTTPLANRRGEEGEAPTWIWYPGDFEIWLGNIFNNRRTERGAMFPPFWKQDSHYVTVEFTTNVELEEDEIISIKAEGQYNFAIDGQLKPPYTNCVPKGSHKLSIKVWNQATPPALFISGKTIHTDSTWLVTYEDKIWIDENGVAHGSGIYVPAGSWNFNSPETPPSQYKLERREMRPVSKETLFSKDDQHQRGILYDFGRETFGYLKIKGLENGKADIYYGESREEALDKKHCETLDELASWNQERMTDKKTRTYELVSKAFRYVYIETAFDTWYDDVLMDYEYAPFDPAHSGAFRCSDDLLNKIWDVAAYTMDLTTREFFMDGIKRDRWTWTGDAIQSYLMNYYLRFDTECVKRTIRQLRGKDPVTAHINTIMDYTFFWFKSILDYYEYTGDVAFVREMWPRMVTLMDYVLSRTSTVRGGFPSSASSARGGFPATPPCYDTTGMAEGQPDDWIFVDWVDFPMHKRGTLCFEQILLMKALETMALCADLVAATVPHASASVYRVKAEELRNKINQTFWSDEQKAYFHAIEMAEPHADLPAGEQVLNEQITKFPNMFAILYGLADEEQRREIMQSVMLNPDIPVITTPYMRFYELETLCIDGRQKQVTDEMKAYWGGMLREGATSFWEKYVPSETGTQHLAMYGRPYGKSLCHAWGASPIYILGKYYLGVRPTKPGYEEYEVRPNLGGLDWIKGSVPTPHGMITVSMDRHHITVRATEGTGWLIIGDQRIRIEPGNELSISL